MWLFAVAGHAVPAPFVLQVAAGHDVCCRGQHCELLCPSWLSVDELWASHWALGTLRSMGQVHSS